MRKILLILCCLGFVACDSNKPALPEQITEQEKTYPICNFSNMEKKPDFLIGESMYNTETKSKKENGHFEVNQTQLISCICMFSHSDYECELPQEELLYKNTYKETEFDGKYHELDQSNLLITYPIGKLTSRGLKEKRTQAVLENVSAICTVKCNDKLKEISNMEEDNISQDSNKMIGRCYFYKIQEIYGTKENGKVPSLASTSYVCGCYDDIKGEEKFRKFLNSGQIGETVPNEECNAKCTEWCNKDEEEREKSRLSKEF